MKGCSVCYIYILHPDKTCFLKLAYSASTVAAMSHNYMHG